MIYQKILRPVWWSLFGAPLLLLVVAASMVPAQLLVPSRAAWLAVAIVLPGPLAALLIAGFGARQPSAARRSEWPFDGKAFFSFLLVAAALVESLVLLPALTAVNLDYADWSSLGPAWATSRGVASRAYQIAQPNYPTLQQYQTACQQITHHTLGAKAKLLLSLIRNQPFNQSRRAALGLFAYQGQGCQKAMARYAGLGAHFSHPSKIPQIILLVSHPIHDLILGRVRIIVLINGSMRVIPAKRWPTIRRFYNRIRAHEHLSPIPLHPWLGQ